MTDRAQVNRLNLFSATDIENVIVNGLIFAFSLLNTIFVVITLDISSTRDDLSSIIWLVGVFTVHGMQYFSISKLLLLFEVGDKEPFFVRLVVRLSITIFVFIIAYNVALWISVYGIDWFLTPQNLYFVSLTVIAHVGFYTLTLFMYRRGFHTINYLIKTTRKTKVQP